MFEVGNVGSIRIKSSGEDRERRTVTIADETNCSVQITLWGPNAHLQIDQGMIVAFKNCRVSDFSGCTLNAASDDNSVKLNIQHPKAQQIKKWFSQRPLADHLKQTQSLTEDKNSGGNRNQDGLVTVGEMKRMINDNPNLMSGEAVGYY